MKGEMESSRGKTRWRFPRRGVTLPELLMALTLAGVILAVSASGFRRFREAAGLHAAGRTVRVQLDLARRLAVTRRETVRMQATPTGDLVLLTPSDSPLAIVHVGRSGDLHVDSVRLRPRALRFNARGQAAPGSVYLFRGRRGIRLVSNFLGRVRQEPLRQSR
jgi:prepilin-type N-terminal cleavage/methylation domain-containing protein